MARPPPQTGLPAGDECRVCLLVERRRDDEAPTFRFRYAELDDVVDDVDAGDSSMLEFVQPMAV